MDTPGFDDTNRSDSEVLKDVAFWLAAAYTKDTQLAGIIYLHRIIDVRMAGSMLRNLRMFHQLCGENNLNSVILATTHWKDKKGISVAEDVGQARIDELVRTKEFWGGMVQKGSKVVRHDGSRESALKIVTDLVDRRIRVVLDIQRQLIDEQRGLNDTDAGVALQGELRAERKKWEAKLSDLQENMEYAVRVKDEEMQEQLKQDRAQYDAKIAATYAETEALRTNIAQMAKEKEEQFRALEEKMRIEREQNEERLAKKDKELEDFRDEQRREAERNRQEKEEGKERAARQARDHDQAIRSMETRLRGEHNEAIRKQIEAEKQDSKRRWQEQRAQDQAATREREKRWEDQQRAARATEASLARERDEERARAAKWEKESRKRKRFILDAVKTVCAVAGLAVKVAAVLQV